MKLRTLVAVCCVLWLVPAVAQCQERTHDITPEDYGTLPVITEISVSNGGTPAWTVATWDKSDDSRKTDLWAWENLAPIKNGPVKLTFDRANDRAIKWSADGICFLGNRKRAGETKAPYDGTTQLWHLLRVGGQLSGEPKALTRELGGIAGYDYAPKAKMIFVQIDATVTDDSPFAKLKSKYGKLDYGHNTRKVSEIYTLDPSTWQLTKLVAHKRYIREFSVSGDGKRIAMITAYDDSVVKSEGESRVDVWEDGKVTTPPTDCYRQKAASPHAWLQNLCWSPDGKRFAFCAVFDGYPTEIVIGTKANDGWNTKYVNRHDNNVFGYGSPLKFSNSETLLFLLESAGCVGTQQIDAVAAEIDAAKGALDAHVSLFDVGEKGRLITTVESDGKGFPVLMRLDNNGGQKKTAFDLYTHTKTWKLPSIQHITWKAPDGTSVGGVLELPYGYKKGDKPLPLAVMIHGGPTSSTKADLNFDPHNGRLYFAAAGYAVLCPNYRGSSGYGDKFLTDLVGHENDLDVKDILAGIQHLIKEGIADPDRIGVGGWSNGGYLTNCLITLKNPPVKFKAASSGAGIIDTVLEWGTNDEPAYAIVMKKGLPWEKPDIYKKGSPAYGLGNVTTPTLIHVGGNDERCPPGNSKLLYRALKEYLKVPTELVIYPGEPHGLTKLSHRKAKMEWDLAWFNKYVKGDK